MPVFDLHAELMAIVDAFAASEIEHAVCGAHALAVHGHPRATKDIDVLVRPADISRGKAVLRALGYRLEAAPMRFRSGVCVHPVSRVESDDILTVDLIEAEGPVAHAFVDRVEVAWQDRALSVVSRESLVEMKRLAGRPQDLADLDALGAGDE